MTEAALGRAERRRRISAAANAIVPAPTRPPGVDFISFMENLSTAEHRATVAILSDEEREAWLAHLRNGREVVQAHAAVPVQAAAPVQEHVTVAGHAEAVLRTAAPEMPTPPRPDAEPAQRQSRQQLRAMNRLRKYGIDEAK